MIQTREPHITTDESTQKTALVAAIILALMLQGCSKSDNHETSRADGPKKVACTPTKNVTDPENARRQLEAMDIFETQSAIKFFEAIKRNDKKAVELFLASGMNPNATEDVYQTLGDVVVIVSSGKTYSALSYAIMKGHQDIASLLLDKCANLDENASRYAIETRNQDIVNLLLSKGMQPSLDSIFSLVKGTPYPDTFALSLAQHVDVNRLSNFESLVRAAREIQFSSNCVDSDLSCTSTSDVTRIEIIGALIARGMKLEFGKKGHSESALLTSIRQISPNPILVSLLVRSGADPNVSNNNSNDSDLKYYNKTPLMYAAEKGMVNIVQLLLDKNAELEAQNGTGMTAMMFAADRIESSKNEGYEIIKVLIGKGADVNATNAHGTPLMYALRRKNIKIAHLLLENGAKVDVRDVHKGTPLMLAVSAKDINMVNVLLNKGVDVNAVSADGYTALMSAVDTQEVDMVKALLGKGANVNAKDSSGNSVLMLAASAKDANIVVALVEKGADVNYRNTKGDSALVIAGRKERWGTVEYLKSKTITR